MPPKKYKAAASREKVATTVTDAKKCVSRAVKSDPPNLVAEGQAAQRPLAAPDSKGASRTVTQRSSLVISTTAVASKKKRSVRTPSNIGSTSSYTNTSDASASSPKPSRSRQASGARRRRSSPSPTVATRKGATTTLAPISRSRRDTVTSKTPSQKNNELHGSRATNRKGNNINKVNGNEEEEEEEEENTVAASPPPRSTTRVTQPIAVVTSDDDDAEETRDMEDNLLFCSDVDMDDADDTAGCSDSTRRRTHISPTASTATELQRHPVMSSEASLAYTLPPLRRGSGCERSSGSTLDLCDCTTSSPPSQQLANCTTRATRHDGDDTGSDSLGSHCAERSPEVLTGDSETKRGRHRWQQHIFTGSTPATQRLCDEEQRVTPRDGSDQRARLSASQAAHAVKQLFIQSTCSLPSTPASAYNSPNDTLVMGPGSEGEGEKHAQGPHQRQQHPSKKVSTCVESDSITTGSDSESWWSLGTSTDVPSPPPGSARTVTPSPPPSPKSSATRAVDEGEPFYHAPGQQVSMQLMAVNDSIDTSPSQQPGTVARAMPPLPAPAGHLRMSGNTSRQRSPSSSASPYLWLRRTMGGGGVAESNHALALPSSMTPSSISADTLFLQQQHTYPHLGPTSLSQLADMDMTTMKHDADAEGGDSATGTSPQRLRLREPPVWRSPQASQLPTSLSVSPASLRGDGGGSIVTSNTVSFLAQPLPQTQSAALSVSAAHVTTGEATQIFAQDPTHAAGGSGGPGQAPPNASVAALAAGRPSTQLIRKAAATRPLASPGTMWICLDDDNSEDDPDGGDNTHVAAPHGDGTDAPANSVKKETDTEVDEGMSEVRWSSLGHAAPAGAPTSPSGRRHDGRITSGDQDKTQIYGKLKYRPPSPEKADKISGTDPPDNSNISAAAAAASGQLRRRPPTENSHPIAEILSPTFRPRRRTAETSADTAPVAGARSTLCQWPSMESAFQCYINMDDETEDDDGDADEAPPRQRVRVDSALDAVPRATEKYPRPVLHHPLSVTGPKMHSQLPMSFIIDDDDDDGDTADPREGDGVLQKEVSGARKADEEALSSPLRKPKNRIAVSEVSKVVGIAEEDHSGLIKSPLKPNVKDFIFPNRLDPELRPSSPLYKSIHAYQRQYQQQLAHGRNAREHSAAPPASPFGWNENMTEDVHHALWNARDAAAHKDTKEASTFVTEASRQAGHKRSRAKDTETKVTASAPAIPDWGRPADTLLRDFFPTKFTKKSFMQAAKNVMSPMHFLQAGDFWAAFTSAEFVGEGSFGLVWRCLTVDGDLVAVKSCPISLRTKANIEDSFSTIREIATMRFLNEMQVPYVLPLHSAFFVHEREALPPLAQEALQWRQQLRKKAEDTALEMEVKHLGRRGHRRASHTVVGNAKDVPLTLEQQVATQLERLAVEEGPEEQATRARLQSVRLPRFLSISEEDLIQSDATAFLVTELCDGDVEDISRSDGITKGVVYCVSTALAAMHELGLLHLDLKPSNILFAFEHGPSQQQQQLLSTSSNAMDAVKFYISDFGNCRLVGPDPMDEVQESYGTFEYMDLRALRDAVCGRPTDAFSLGATLYELLYGKRLYPKCVNPRCHSDEDHSRECYVEAASQPVVLPTLGPPTATATILPALRASPDVAVCEHAPACHTQGGISNNSSSSLTPLQCLILALLRQSWSERMTAEECRRYLVQTFNITQTENPPPSPLKGEGERSGL